MSGKAVQLVWAVAAAAAVAPVCGCDEPVTAQLFQVQRGEATEVARVPADDALFSTATFAVRDGHTLIAVDRVKKDDPPLFCGGGLDCVHEEGALYLDGTLVDDDGVDLQPFPSIVAGDDGFDVAGAPVQHVGTDGAVDGVNSDAQLLERGDDGRIVGVKDGIARFIGTGADEWDRELDEVRALPGGGYVGEGRNALPLFDTDGADALTFFDRDGEATAEVDVDGALNVSDVVTDRPMLLPAADGVVRLSVLDDAWRIDRYALDGVRTARVAAPKLDELTLAGRDGDAFRDVYGGVLDGSTVLVALSPVSTNAAGTTDDHPLLVGFDVDTGELVSTVEIEPALAGVSSMHIEVIDGRVLVLVAGAP